SRDTCFAFFELALRRRRAVVLDAAPKRKQTHNDWGNVMEATLDKYRPQMLSILRIMVGLLFMSAGIQKWFAFPVAMPAAANITLFSMLGVAGCIELIGGTLVAVGLFTRYAAFIL